MINKCSTKYGVISLIVLSFMVLFSCKTKTDDTSKNINSEIVVKQQVPKKAEIYITARDSENRLKKVNQVDIKKSGKINDKTPAIIVDPQKTFQSIVGFGGALTDASAETFYKLPESAQNEIMKAYFDTESGIGYSFCRTPIHSCDFSSKSYSYAEIAGDSLLTHFSIDRDWEFKLPFIKKALSTSGNKLKFLASPWSPPAWMKTNNNMLQGGKLKPEYYKTWANYYVRFIDEYTKAGVPIWGLTVQNEPMAVQPWESCIYTAEEERDFVKNYLGPILKKSAYPETKIVIWDHNRGMMYQRGKTSYDDPEAAKYIWGLGLHWYVGDHFNNVKLLNEAYPDKNILFTEGCVTSFDTERLNDWSIGERYGESILHDLNNGAVGWVDWNILLDETGGPNHVSNFCFAPIIGDTKTGKLNFMNSYYYLGHFSKFIRPGAKRIVSSSNKDGLLTTAFLNKDNSIVVIVLNMNNRDFLFNTWIENSSFEAKSPAHSIITMVLK